MRFFLIQHAFLLFAFFVSCKLQGQESKEPEKTVELAGYYKMAMVYLNGDGVDQNYPLAFKWFEKAAKLGHAESQFNLGWMYSSGAGGIKDLALAAKCYSQAADQGLTVAQFNLGRAITMAKAFPKILKKRFIGIQLRQIRAMQWLKIIWVCCTMPERGFL